MESSIDIVIDEKSHLIQDENATSDSMIVNLSFLAPLPLYDVEKPYYIDGFVPPGVRKSNIVSAAFPTRVINARGSESQFSPVESSFGWFNHDLVYEVNSEESIDKYLHEMEGVLKEHLKANKVFAYDYVMRQQWKEGQPRPGGLPPKTKRPIMSAHLDIGDIGTQRRVKYHLPEQSEELLKGRYQIVNCWRPLIDKIENHPLAVCDSRTLPEEDLIPSDVVFPHLEIGAFEVWYNANQRWYYLRHQRKNEVLLMVNYDSEHPGLRCAHTSFEDPSALENSAPRQSIEVRFMAFYDIDN